jgi:hypothetical protein
MRVQSWKSPEGTQHHTPLQESEWSVTATGDNAAATVARPGESGRSHYVTYIGGSYSGAVTGGEMLLKDGAEVVGDYFVHDQRSIALTYPLRISEGAGASLTLAAGSLGVRGACTLQGYTV